MNNDDIIIKEILKLRREVDSLKKILYGTQPQQKKIALGPFSSTKEERKSLREHVAQLDKQLSSPPKKKVITKTNLFKVGQLVQLVSKLGLSKGKVAFIACAMALPSQRQCDKESCNHDTKSYVWVYWENKKLIAHHFDKLKLLTEEYLKPRIGRELSGKIGCWEYNKDTKVWKKDGDEKLYTAEEFADFMFYEENPDAKEDGKNLVKVLMSRGKKKC